MLAGGDMIPVVFGAGETELKPTRSLRLAPWELEIGFGAANWVAEVDDGVGLGGRGRPRPDGFDVVCVCGFGVADWKSSKSSSSLAPTDKESNPLSIGCGLAFLPFAAKSLGGVFGGISSTSKLRMSISGSFFFGGAVFWGSLRADDDDDAASGFGLDVLGVLPSSPSSYSSNLSRRLVESWKSDLFPPKPPPSP